MHHVSNACLIYDDVEPTGAFCKVGSSNVVPTGANSLGAHLGFDASRSSAVYGSSNSVMPPSARLILAIRI